MSKQVENQTISDRTKTSPAIHKTERNAVSALPEDQRMVKISQRLRQLRMEKGYSSAEIFAYEHDLNRSSYWRMEKGYNITVLSLLRVLDIHGLTLKEFFEEFD